MIGIIRHMLIAIPDSDFLWWDIFEEKDETKLALVHPNRISTCF